MIPNNFFRSAHMASMQTGQMPWLLRTPSMIMVLLGLISLVLLNIGLIGLQIRNVANANRNATATQLRILLTTEVTRDFVDAETGQRGFLITNNLAYLEPYQVAVARISEQMSVLRRAFADSPVARQHLSRVNDLWLAKRAELQDTIEYQRNGQQERVRERVLSNVGKQFMDTIRAEFGDIAMLDQMRLREQMATMASAEAISSMLITAALGFTGFGVLLAVHQLRRRNTQLSYDVSRASIEASNLRQDRNALEQQVTAAREQLSNAARQLSATLSSAPVVLFGQDTALRYKWFHGTAMGRGPEWFLGRTDYELNVSNAQTTIIENKLTVLATGEPRQYEVLIGHGEQTRWFSTRLSPTLNQDGQVDGVEGIGADITERKQNEQHIRLLMRELAHRSKNILAVVQAVARQTAANAPNIEQFTDKFSSRLTSLAASHSLLIEEEWGLTNLKDLANAQLGHFGAMVDGQIKLTGGQLMLPANAVQTIGLALHELATNAAKYGALSVPEGSVHIRWTVEPMPDGANDVTIHWSEMDGPSVIPPTRSGFGRCIIERSVVRGLAGKVELLYAQTGVQWKLNFMLRAADNAAA